MSAGWLVYDAIVVALVAAAAWAVESLFRQLGRPARWSWLAAAVTVIALVARAAIMADGSPASYLLAKTAGGPAMLPLATEGTLLAAARAGLALTGAYLGAAATGAARLVPAWIADVAAMLWVAGSVATLFVLALVHLRLRRARRVWPEAELHGSRVRIAPRVGPAVVGVVRPEIVVPRWLLGCTPDEQRLVLTHESEHLRARDHLLLVGGSLVVALVPWHPAVWWMLARLRLAIELDCDARVLRRGVPAKDYGTLLIDLAGRCTGFRVGATALAEEGSHLERRLIAMNDNRAGRRRLRAGVLGATAGLALLAACEAKVPTAAEIDAMDVAGAAHAAVGARMLSRVQLDSAAYFVDGRRVDSRTANALTPDRIATINVTKGDSLSVIHIVTTGPKAPVDSGAFVRGSYATITDGHVSMKQRVSVGRMDQFSGMIVIDGVRSDASALQALDPNAIASIDVIKGAAATALSTDPAAKNGIIRVTTKR